MKEGYISIFAISIYDTDYILVKDKDIDSDKNVLSMKIMKLYRGFCVEKSSIILLDNL